MSFTRRPWWRRWFGLRSERAAARHLRRRGLRVIAQNVHTPGGEIDLIALHGDTLVVAEVRSTESLNIENAALSVDAEKQRRVTRAAVAFFQKHGLLGRPARFDVLVLSWPPGEREPTVSHYENAFEAVGDYQMDY